MPGTSFSRTDKAADSTSIVHSGGLGCTVTVVSAPPLAPWGSVAVKRNVRSVSVATGGAVKLALSFVALVIVTCGLPDTCSQRYVMDWSSGSSAVPVRDTFCPSSAGFGDAPAVTVGGSFTTSTSTGAVPGLPGGSVAIAVSSYVVKLSVPATVISPVFSSIANLSDPVIEYLTGRPSGSFALTVTTSDALMLMDTE